MVTLRAISTRVYRPGIVLLAVAACSAGGASPPAAQNLARYDVELRFTGISGTAGGATGCPGARRDGTDILTGVVSANESQADSNEDWEDDAIRYRGTLKRTTNLSFCEPWQLPSGDTWCVPSLTGTQDRVNVIIKVYSTAYQTGMVSAPGNVDAAWVEFTPVRSAGDTVTVNGACSAGMGADITASYGERTTFAVVTSQGHPLRDRLSVGRWQDLPVRPASQPDGWTLTVKARIQ